MKYIKQFEVFFGSKNLTEDFYQLKSDFEKFNKNIKLGLEREGVFENFLKYIEKAISIFNKMHKKTYSLEILEECYKFIYENTLIIDNMPSISSFHIDTVKKIYVFLNEWNDDFEEKFPERRFKFTINVPRD